MNTVALLHTDLQVAERLAQVIASAPDCAVQGVAQGFPALRALFSQSLPNLLLVDLMLPTGHVRALLHDLHAHAAGSRPQVLVLAVSPDDPRVMDALRHGADGYFAHGPSSLSLIDAIQQILRGESAMTPQIAREVKAHFDEQAGFEANDSWRDSLCDADLRLLQWMAEGFLINEVAQALQLSVHGVGLRIRHIYRQLQSQVRAASRAMPLSAA